ncbi:MAG: nucleoside triphosphate hydrolase [Deinococcota bacterium]|jgi:XTP/dITP diphosphohydrolase|nr:nucleoside triphosphate hydrolase [Deinococcota bacterium]
MQRLLEIMRRLRAPDGCPWDREQTHLSLRPYLLEEAAEAVDALSGGHPAEVADELGDVLLQVAFHAVIAEEAGTFSYDTVETAIVDKLRRRHPHVFGDVRADTPAEVLENWQALKAKEGRLGSEVPSSLPALMRAQQLGHKRGWPAGSAPGLEAALGALHEASPVVAERAVGELLLAAVDLARGVGVNAELALREATRQREKAGESGPRKSTGA